MTVNKGYPTGAAEREERRARTREYWRRFAERKALEVDRSLVCAEGNHERCSGALNCLCECHDPDDSAVRVQDDKGAA